MTQDADSTLIADNPADQALDGRVAAAHCGRRRRRPALADHRRRGFSYARNPPITKEDFAAGFRKVSAKASIESTQDVKEIRAARDTAYAWSHLTVALTPIEGGKRTESTGYVLSVFFKSSSGKWLLAREANLVAGAGNPDRV